MEATVVIIWSQMRLWPLLLGGLPRSSHSYKLNKLAEHDWKYVPYVYSQILALWKSRSQWHQGLYFNPIFWNYGRMASFRVKLCCQPTKCLPATLGLGYPVFKSEEHTFFFWIYFYTFKFRETGHCEWASIPCLTGTKILHHSCATLSLVLNTVNSSRLF